MSLSFQVNPIVDCEQVKDLLQRAQLDRPEEDSHRLARITPRLNVVIGAYDGRKLVGLARGLKEYSGCCYLSDLVIDRAYQCQDLGGALIRQVREIVGEHALILLVPSPDALEFSA